MVSGFAVALSTACLYFANDVIFSSLATGTIVVVLVAMVSSLTVLPALLVKLGRWIDHPRLPLINRLSHQSGHSKLWPVILKPAMKHPLVTLVVAVAVMVGLALPAMHLQLGEEGRNTFSDSIPAVRTFHQMTTLFPTEAASHLIVIRNDSASLLQLKAAVNDITSRTESNVLFGGRDTTSVTTTKDDKLTTIKIPIPYDASTTTAVRSLHELRTQIIPPTIGHVPGVTYAVTGDVARNVDYNSSQQQQLPLVIGLLLLVTFIMMLPSLLLLLGKTSWWPASLHTSHNVPSSSNIDVLSHNSAGRR